MLTTKANTLTAAISMLDHTRPLAVAELEKFYVRRDDVNQLLKRMQLQLELQYPCKSLLTGHRGSGKSSALAFLADTLDAKKRLWIVHFSLFEELDINDLSHVDIIFVLAVKILQSCAEHSLKLEGYDERLNTWASDIEIVKEEQQSMALHAEAGAGIEVPKWLGSPVKALLSIGAKVGKESSTRKTVRQQIEPDFQELLGIIDDLQQAIYQETEKRVTCLIDGCDKASIATAENLFYRNGQSLAAPTCSIVYTFPVALQHSNDFNQLSAYFADTFTLPNYKVQHRHADQSTEISNEIPNGIAKLKEIISRRVDYTLFDADALEKLAYASGGIVRTAILLAQKAVIQALVQDAAKVDVRHVDAAIADERRDFARQLSNKQLDLLARVHQTHAINNDPEAGYRELLHNLSVIEYVNGDVWYGVSPLVMPLLAGASTDATTDEA